MSLAYLTRDDGEPVKREDISDAMQAALDAHGLQLVDGFLEGRAVLFVVDPKDEAERISAAVDRFVAADARSRELTVDVFIPDLRRPSAASVHPTTESDSRQRRRWLARKGKRT